MKSTSLLLATATLCALSACSSPPDIYLTNSAYGKARRAPATAKPVSPPAAAPVVPVAPPAPAVSEPEPVAVAPAPVVAPVTVVAVPEPVVIAPPAPVEPRLDAVRTGATVNLTWTLPPAAAGYRAIEVMRNTVETANGRGRIKAVRATVTQLTDTVPDAAANYWYWLKLTTNEGAVVNMGPVAAGSAQ